MPRRSRRVATGFVALLGAALPLAFLAPSATAAPAAPPVVNAAAEYVVANTDTADAPGDIADAVIGLAAAQADVTDIAPLADLLEDKAPAYATTAGPAAKLAIAAVATGRNPRDFGGVDLVAVINGDLDAGGSYSGYEDVFTQGLVILGLHRTGQPVPQAAVDWLLAQQDQASGLFGYNDFQSGQFVADNDYSGFALQALVALSQDQPSQGVSDAIAALVPALEARKQTPANGEGYFDGFSPVNSTAVVGPGLEESGVDVADLTAWMSGQQVADGGFPSTLNGTASDLKAAVQALLFLAGGSLVDSAVVDAPPVAVPTSSAPSSGTPPTSAAPIVTDPGTTVAPDAQGGTGLVIAETGATPEAGLWTGLVAVTLGVMVLVGERRTRRTYARKH